MEEGLQVCVEAAGVRETVALDSFKGPICALMPTSERQDRVPGHESANARNRTKVKGEITHECVCVCVCH